MNERIKELAEQAAGNFTQNFKWNYLLDIDKDIFEKFAELILQDIDRIVDELYHAVPLEQAAVLLTLDEQIKQHFYGVEL